MKQTKLLLPLSLFVLISLSASSQGNPDNHPSPLAVETMRYKDAYVKITYSQPDKRGREIFGDLIPYGKVWRTGANEATEITTTKNITLRGFLLKAGTYSIFTIPNKDKWTIIINNELGLIGSYNYNSKLDYLRFDVVPQSIPNEVYEKFRIQFIQRNESADLLLLWDKVKVVVPVKFLN
ncbi:MAG: DUF2911 domain-containing protein [Chryseolinea sp.]